MQFHALFVAYRSICHRWSQLLARYPKSRRTLSGLALCAVLAIPETTVAETRRSGTLAEKVQAADAIIRGTVVEVDYRMSAWKGAPSVPFTFVTYAVDEVLSGRVESDVLTLRFIGGADGRGGFFQVGDTPHFDEGDEDVLFVQGNGSKECPLAHCAGGRFRIHDDRIYGADGTPLTGWRGGKAQFQGRPPDALSEWFVPTPSFDDAIQDPAIKAFVDEQLTAGVSLETWRERYRREAPPAIRMSVAAPQYHLQKGTKPPAAALPAPAFLARVRTLADRGQSEKSAPTIIPDLDPDQPLVTGGDLRLQPASPHPLHVTNQE